MLFFEIPLDRGDVRGSALIGVVSGVLAVALALVLCLPGAAGAPATGVLAVATLVAALVGFYGLVVYVTGLMPIPFIGYWLALLVVGLVATIVGLTVSSLAPTVVSSLGLDAALAEPVGYGLAGPPMALACLLVRRLVTRPSWPAM